MKLRRLLCECECGFVGDSAQYAAHADKEMREEYITAGVLTPEDAKTRLLDESSKEVPATITETTTTVEVAVE